MREVRKRLTVKNDGFCKSNTPANKRINKVINRHVLKMSVKGWVPADRPSAGNSFSVYEAYVHMCLPASDEELDQTIKSAIEYGWVESDGIFHWPTN